MDVPPIYVLAYVPGKSGENVATHWVYRQFVQCAIRANFSVAHEDSSRKLSRVNRLVTKVDTEVFAVERVSAPHLSASASAFSFLSYYASLNGGFAVVH